ncbi:hypothetical protein [Massilia sp. CCM 8734]|uniref:hypothetical protein n=1 Tax=Massilia sp. CCM 8734 TaxID=2609283 RepID=UPI00142400EB|nr:hypothetical protein [Massilia sp. CCM 8734]NHZ94497.1 hypothetical protein [Massilia sp. CCM 8734]
MNHKSIVIALAYILANSNAYAACLGLGPPTPKTTNICERLVDRLVIPQTKVFCELPWYARIFMPQCNLPGACHVDPICKSFEVTREVAEVVLNAGDLYCDFRQITPERMIEGIRDQTFTDSVKLTTGGTSSILFDVANRHIDSMSCNGSPLNEKLKEWVACVASKSTVPQDTYFYPIDVNRAVIISKTNPTADLYLRRGFDAITLDDLVIIEDDKFQILRNWSKGIGEALNDAEQSALKTMIHELVHVRQYRNIGKESFINLYLAEAIASSYANIRASCKTS